MDAPIAPRPSQFPIVLLSHGSGGKADKLFWLTDYLVRHGVVVIATDHAGNMTGDSSADGMMRVWERPKDLIFALDQILHLQDFKSRLDVSKLAATGHSAGGTTVLLLGGTRAGFADSCKKWTAKKSWRRCDSYRMRNTQRYGLFTNLELQAHC